MQNKMSLINFDVSNDLTVYSGLLNKEMIWLFNNRLPAQVLFIPNAYNGAYYNSYIQKVIQTFASFKVGVKLITDGNPADLIKLSQCIVVGGGSLEKLLEGVNNYKQNLKVAISGRKPFLGWNEGAVLPCPAYVVPAVLPVSPKCLGATLSQIYAHYVDSDLNRMEIRNFLLNHQNDVPPIAKVICLPDRPGGSGIRLEDDVIALDYAGDSPVDPTIQFTLETL